MLRSSTTGQGLTGKVHSDFAGKYNIAGGAEVTLSFSSGTAGDVYSSGKICPLGLGKYAWHVPNAVFASLGNVSAVLSVTGGIDVHFEWLVVADSRDLATKPVNVTQFGGTNGTFASGVPDVKVASMAANALTAAAISADAGAELAALVETYIVNEGDATAVMQAIADKIAADWVAGDASPLAIASAVWAAGSRTITGGSLTTSPPTTSEILTALGTGSWATSLASQSSVTQIVNALPASGHLAGSADSNGAVELNSGALRAALGMAAADLDDQLDAILAAGGAGTGARTVTITVNDGTTALQNATVRMTEGVNSYTALTDADGVAVFNLDDATYTVSITKSGYSYTGTTLVVNGTETATYSMTAISVTPPTSPSKSAIEVLCVDENVDAESGVAVDFRIVTIPTGDQNIAYKGTKQTATSDVDGIARFEVARGSVCEYKRGEADVWQRVTVDNDSVTNVTSFIGSP